MNDKKYEMYRITKEFSWKERCGIKPGCTMDGVSDTDVFLQGSFDSLQEAMDVLKHKDTYISELSSPVGKYFVVEEYFVSENFDSEDYEIRGWSGLSIKVYDEDTDELIGIYNNWEDAEKVSLSRENTYMEY